MLDRDALVAAFSLEGKTVLVTGAARGLGWAMAVAMSRAGAHVVLNDLNLPALEARAGELQSCGLAGSIEAFDVTQEAAVNAGISQIIARCGQIDILINNAGNQNRKPVTNYSLAEWEAVHRTHVTGSFLVSRAVIPGMRERGAGRIIMISSVAATSTKADLAAYASAKGAVASLARALAVELGPYGVTCNALAPGFIETDFTRALVDDETFSARLRTRVPLGRWGAPEDIAQAAVFLGSKAGGFVNGSVLTIDGGLLAAL